MRTWTLVTGCAALLFLFGGCGDNLANPGTPSAVDPPRNITGLAVNATTVRIWWQLPIGVADSLVRSVRIEYNGVIDSVPRSTSSYTAYLLTGSTEFQISLYLRSGVHSSPVAFRWAPAARFDSAYVLTEYDPAELTRLSGLHAGSGSSNPRTLTLDQASQSAMHLYLSGAGGQPLRLLSASRYLQGWNQTLFSTITHAAVSLDYDLAAYPQDYVNDNVELTDNTIYYAHVAGTLGQVYSVRLHVHLVPGTAYPDRQVQVRISIQRTPGVLFASVVPARGFEVVPQRPAIIVPAASGLAR